jgi:hypothetical protein
LLILAEQAGGAVHDEAAIEQAWGRVRKFFGRHLSADPRVQEIVGGVEGPTRRAQVIWEKLALLLFGSSLLFP